MEKRKLRVSSYKDYIAVDLVDDKGNVTSTPLYLKRQGMCKIFIDGKETNLFLNSNSDGLLTRQFNPIIDGKLEFEDLLNEKVAFMYD